jgi:hypothetical protein
MGGRVYVPFNLSSCILNCINNSWKNNNKKEKYALMFFTHEVWEMIEKFWKNYILNPTV